ncbi:DUF5133 domain-containing protein [Streptomyces sp. NPDC001373]|uniref:DUF5133 domain-containing protein n=1 Tax=Streptomyces sp. NPDC001373 TaxID=3364565 RepID=UPI003684C536
MTGDSGHTVPCPGPLTRLRSQADATGAIIRQDSAGARQFEPCWTRSACPAGGRPPRRPSRPPRSVLDAADEASPVRNDIRDVEHALCVATGTADVHAALMAVRHHLPGTGPLDDSVLDSR